MKKEERINWIMFYIKVKIPLKTLKFQMKNKILLSMIFIQLL